MILLTSKWTAIYGFEFIPPAEEDLSSYMDVSIQSYALPIQQGKLVSI